MKRTFLIYLSLFLLICIMGCQQPVVDPDPDPDPSPPLTYATLLSGNSNSSYAWSYGLVGDQSFVDVRVGTNGELYLAMDDDVNGFNIVKTLPSGGEDWRTRYLDDFFINPGSTPDFWPVPTGIVLDANGHIHVSGHRSGPTPDFWEGQAQGFVVEVDGVGTMLGETEINGDCGESRIYANSIDVLPAGDLVYGGEKRYMCPWPNMPLRAFFVNGFDYVSTDTHSIRSQLSELKADAAGNIVSVGLGGPNGDELNAHKSDLSGNEFFNLSWSDWNSGVYTFTGHCFVEPLANGKILIGAQTDSGTLVALLNAAGNYESHTDFSGLTLFSAEECNNGDLIFSGSSTDRPLLMRTNASFTSLWQKFYAGNLEGTLYRVRNAPGGGFAACGEVNDPGKDLNGLVLRTDANGN